MHNPEIEGLKEQALTCLQQDNHTDPLQSRFKFIEHIKPDNHDTRVCGHHLISRRLGVVCQLDSIMGVDTDIRAAN